MQCGGRSLEVAVTVRASWLAPALTLLSEAITTPMASPESFASEVESQRTERQELASGVGSVGVAMAARALVGGHSAARPRTGTLEEISAIRPEDVAQFYGRHFNPQNGALVVVGDAMRSAVEPAVAAAFSAWAQAGPTLGAPQELEMGGRDDPRWVMVDNRDSPNALITLVWRTANVDDADYAATRVLELGLASMFSGRLNRALRERFGMTYGVHADWYLSAERGFVAVRTTVDVANVAAALDLARQTIGAVHRSGLDAAEVEAAKARLRDGFVSSFESNYGVAGEVRGLIERSESPSAWLSYLTAYDAVDVAAVRSVAQRRLSSTSLAGSIVGDLRTLEPLLRSDSSASRWVSVTVVP